MPWIVWGFFAYLENYTLQVTAPSLLPLSLFNWCLHFKNQEQAFYCHISAVWWLVAGYSTVQGLWLTNEDKRHTSVASSNTRTCNRTFPCIRFLVIYLSSPYLTLSLFKIHMGIVGLQCTVGLFLSLFPKNQTLVSGEYLKYMLFHLIPSFQETLITASFL